MKKRKSRDIFRFILIIAIIIVLNIIGSIKFFRIDLTAEGRYSLSDATVDLIQSFDDVLYVKIYLDGDFPAGFQRLQRETRQMLDEFRAYNKKIEYEFINPDEGDDPKQIADIKQQLQFKGLKPYRLEVNEQGGNKSLDIFPGAIMSYGEKEAPVLLLLDQFATSPEAQVNNSIQNLEFAIASAIRSLVTQNRPSIGFLQGHGELEPLFIADFAKTLSENYEVDKFNVREFKSDSTGEGLSIQQQQVRLNRFDALFIAKPKKPFTDLDKFLLDQYIMRGGKVIWLIDAVHAEMDSLSQKSQFLSYPTYDKLRLSDMLFKYGVRINTNLVKDLISAGVADRNGVKQWVYFPLIMPQVKHPITKDLNAIRLNFASSIDTIISKGVRKTVLLKTSPYSALAPTPHMVNLSTLYQEQNQQNYTRKFLNVGVLLEGEFESIFKNRILPKDGTGNSLKLIEKSIETQMLVVSDGDIIRNQLNVINTNIPKGTPLPLGFDQFTGQQYGNKDFLLNVMDYMLDESGLISIRSRELKLRLLNPQKTASEKIYWKLINTLIPIGVVIITGIVFTLIRRRKYS